MFPIFGNANKANYQQTNAQFGRNGHRYSGEAAYGQNDETYYKFRVTSATTADVTYDDPAGNTHTNIMIDQDGERECSGVPTVNAGEIMAWIDDPATS